MKDNLKYTVLDHGFIQYIDHMGSDLTVVNTARVSFNKESDWEYDTYREAHEIMREFGGTTQQWDEVKTNPRLKAGDKKLIKYLADHGHWSPFAHPKVQLRIKMPIFVHRQWDKTRIGFDRNEVSRRYVSYEPEFYTPAYWRAKPEGSKKQGSSNEKVYDISPPYSEVVKESIRIYEDMVANTVAPEQARIVLPLSMYTEIIETGSLYGYARLYGLRASEDAQWEIRQYAQAIDKIMSDLFPVSWEVLKKQDLPEVVPEPNPVEQAINDIESILKSIREKKYTEARQFDGIGKQ